MIDAHKNLNISYFATQKSWYTYQLKTSTGKTISEITSSSLNAAFPNSEEAGPLRIGGTFVDENYGVLYFHSDDNALTLALKNIKGDIVRSLSVQN